MFSKLKVPDLKLKGRAASTATPITSQIIPQPGLSEFQVSGASNPNIDIVFVHGLNGSSAETWKHHDTGFWWPEQLGNDLPDAHILLFNYDTFFDPTLRGTNLIRIPDIARNLCYQLSENRFENGAKRRPLVMIGHSLGGLIIKKALIECNEDLTPEPEDILWSTISILLFGTPNAGSFASDQKRVQIVKWIGESVGYQVPPRIFEALRAHSLELYELSASFQRLKIWNTPMDANPSMLTFYETVTQDKLGIQVVDETSAKVGVRGEKARGVQANHTQMVRFYNENDPTYKSLETKSALVQPMQLLHFHLLRHIQQ
ncbi:Alpha/Beta hydrolase protein [Hypoxylon trugodes]|uniref:Alpha/Beta hydrolase protein n=1 Tax=Hypoxylon trugodes TaxID=326681 RepID=UPI0021934C59|nr:Alpha/Beta hydrolase protein [Hypoxylon trugodes]KAI1393655.1 Alpha/Beta hydrolase protein [Hypoxylon trugodes]